MLLPGKKDIEDILALTPMQEGMLFHYLRDPQGENYLEQLSLEISGEIDAEFFEKAWNVVIQTNEMLRTVFRWEKVEKPIQVILKEHRLRPLYYDLSEKDGNEKKKLLEDINWGDRNVKFDLRDISFRITLCKIKADKYRLLISSHHILYDGWSSGVILKEFFDAYNDLAAGKESVKPRKTKFREFIKWIQTQDTGKQENFWRNYLKGFDARTRLSINRRGNRSGIIRRGNFRIRFGKEMRAEIENFVKNYKVTLASLLYSAWGLLLQRYNDSDDVIFGTTVSGRSARIPGIEDMVGLFINTLPLRVHGRPGEKAGDLPVQLDRAVRVREEYSTTSLAKIKEYGKRELEINEELFDTIVVIENYPLDRRLMLENSTLSADSYAMVEMTHYDLTVGITAFDDIEVRFTYNKEVFEDDAIVRLAGHFKCIAADMVRHPAGEAADIDVIPGEEKNKLLYEFNDSRKDYPGDKPLHRLFEEQVENTPDGTAVVIGRQGVVQLTYRELNKKSNQLAFFLGKKGVGSDTVVSLLVERSLEMIIAVLGVLKAGGAYMPIDPQFPVSRIEAMLSDSNAPLLLTRDYLMIKVGDIPGVLPGLDLLSLDDESLYPGFTSNPSPIAKPGDLAYVLFTSGTTGRPKGVMVEHRNAVNVVTWFGRSYRLESNTHLLQMSDYTFDPSVNQVFGTLLYGAVLYLLDKELLMDTRFLRRYIDIHQIHILNFVPAILNQLLSYGKKLESIRFVLAGGDRLGDSIKDNIIGKGYVLYNMYGPTETTIDALAEKCSKRKVSLGKPIFNAQCYILDKNRNLMPIGVAGGLYIGGTGVGRGYLNRPELTDETFLRESRGRFFQKEPPGRRRQKIYKTGDLARWLPDGNIEFLGRLDDQVKIRGYRVEPGEIETRLIAHQEVKEAVVTANTNEMGAKYLCAYIVLHGSDVPHSSVSFKPSELKKYLSQFLPDYMIPSYFVEADHIPVTSNGKVDRKSLPDPAEMMDNGVPSLRYRAPGNEVEELLVKIWQDVLGAARIGIEDDYFALGGDSINAIQITSRLQRYGLKLEINDLLMNPTIKQMGKQVRAMDRVIDQGSVEGSVELTPVQRWFFESLFTHRHHYNQAVMLYNESRFSEEIVRKVFERIIEHHDALRMIYKFDEGEVFQVDRGVEPRSFDFEIIDLHDEVDIYEEIEREADRIQGGFDLSAGPLVKTGLFKTKKGDYLLIVIHHLVVDGVSWRILLEDFTIGYGQGLRGEKICFQEKTDSFMYWASRLKEYAESGRVLQELDYWNGLDAIEIERLPRDYEPGVEVKKNRNLEIVGLELNEEETGAILKEVNHAYRTEINDILLTALGMAIKEWAGIERVLVNLEGHGREPIIEGLDIGRTVGWFTSLYPVVLDMSKSADLSYEIKFNKETLRKIPGRGIGYGILKYLVPGGKETGLRFRQRPEINFNYMGQFEREIRDDKDTDKVIFRMSDISIGNFRSPDLESLYTINIDGIVIDGRLRLSFAYNKYEYKRESIENLVDGYKLNLHKIVTHCLERTERELTPSDLGVHDISIEELNNIKEMLEI